MSQRYIRSLRPTLSEQFRFQEASVVLSVAYADLLSRLQIGHVTISNHTRTNTKTAKSTPIEVSGMTARQCPSQIGGAKAVAKKAVSQAYVVRKHSIACEQMNQ
jgi:hypothetical protein